MKMNSPIHFANLFFKGVSKDIIFSNIERYQQIVTVNSEFIVKAQREEKLKSIINNNTSTFDGQVPFILAKLRNKKIQFEKISGSDFIYDICSFAQENNKKIFLLGGSAYANSGAVTVLKERYGIGIKGFSPAFQPYPFTVAHNQLILSEIKLFKPDILFVGFGAIKQEYWISDNEEAIRKIGVKLTIGCGGTFDFVSGKILRAPKWMQKLGLEGIFRLLKEPKVFRFKRIIESLKIFPIFLKDIYYQHSFREANNKF